MGITDLMQRHHLWLSTLPLTCNPINLHIWQVVTLAAVTAMDHGRKAMHAMLKAVPANPPPQYHQTPALPIATFALQADFGAYSKIMDINNITPPPPPNHPFFTKKDNRLTLKSSIFLLQIASRWIWTPPYKNSPGLARTTDGLILALAVLLLGNEQL